MESHGYRPLNTIRREIRLLELILTDSSDEAQFKVRHCALEGAPPFIALSYVWGDTSTSSARKILVNGAGKAATTSSLLDALGVIWSRQRALHAEALLAGDPAPPPFFLWADAICINQDDDDEKNHQVSMMKSIYQRAAAVWAWLGPAGDDNEGPRALQTLSRLGASFPFPWVSGFTEGILDDPMGNGLGTLFSSMRHNMRVGNSTTNAAAAEISTPAPTTTAPGPDHMRIIESTRRIFHEQQQNQQPLSGWEHQIASTVAQPQPGFHFATVLSALAADAIIQAPASDFVFFGSGSGIVRLHPTIQRFLARPFWSRVWILQELFFARDLAFFCGDGRDPLFGATIASGVAVCSGIRMLGDLMRFQDVFARGVALGVPPVVQRLNTPPFALAAYLQGRNKVPGDPSGAPGLVELLETIVRMGVEATDPRDVVYAVLGLVEREAGDEGIPIEYAANPVDVYVRATYWTILQTGDLRLVVLACCCREAAGSRGRQSMRGLPTWVPDLSLTLGDAAPLAGPVRRSLVDESVRVGVAGEDGRPTLTLRGVVQGVVVERAEPLPSLAVDGNPPLWGRLAATVRALLDTVRKFRDALPETITLAGIQDSVMRHVLMTNPALGSADIFDARYGGDLDSVMSELDTRTATFASDPSGSMSADVATMRNAALHVLAQSFSPGRGILRGFLDCHDTGGSLDVGSPAYETRRGAWGLLAVLSESVFPTLNQIPTTVEEGDAQTRGDRAGERPHSVNVLERVCQSVSQSLSTMLVLHDGLVGSGVGDAAPGDIVALVCNGDVSFVLRPLSTLERDMEDIHVLCDCRREDLAMDVTLVGEVNLHVGGTRSKEEALPSRLFRIF